MTKQQTAAENELLTFPTDFPMKIMGATTPEFVSVVTDIARHHFEDFDDSTVKVGYSRTRKYTAVSIIVRARSREQLDDMYRACTSHPMIKVVL